MPGGPNPRNPQFDKLPLQLPTYGRDLGTLIADVADDRSFSPAQRIECLEVLFNRVLAETPKLANGINTARLCHKVATLHKRTTGSSRQVSATFIAKLSANAQEVVRQFNSQNVANTAWAFATLRIKDQKLLTALSSQAQRAISSFNSQNVANTAWAFATLGIKDPPYSLKLSGTA